MSQTQRENAPDVRQLRQQDLPETSFPGGRKASFRVFIDPEIHTRVWKHSTEDISVEICGVLVGKWARDADGPFVLISESIRGEAATSKFAEVTFTHATWAKINEQMDTRFAALSIVGWYHSHPGFGVFLSERDRFIQEHFFSGAGQVAYVVDPVRKTEGAFLWKDGKPSLAPHYWVGDRIQVGTPAGEEAPPPPAAQPDSSHARETPASTRPRDPSSWTGVLTGFAMYIFVFLLGYLLAGKLTDLERLRLEQSALARSWYYLKLRPGLREELDQLDNGVRAVAKNTKTLAQEHLKLLEEPKETAAKWSEILQQLDQTSKRLVSLEVIYGLTPQETALLSVLGEGRGTALTNAPPPSKNEKASDKKDEKALDKKDEQAPDKKDEKVPGKKE
jgi:proteasome lid subunit RPN8/RPN11